jgi:hypothetical protein
MRTDRILLFTHPLLLDAARVNKRRRFFLASGSWPALMRLQQPLTNKTNGTHYGKSPDQIPNCI